MHDNRATEVGREQCAVNVMLPPPQQSSAPNSQSSAPHRSIVINNPPFFKPNQTRKSLLYIAHALFHPLHRHKRDFALHPHHSRSSLFLQPFPWEVNLVARRRNPISAFVPLLQDIHIDGMQRGEVVDVYRLFLSVAQAACNGLCHRGVKLVLRLCE
jgi:hypothetical protein